MSATSYISTLVFENPIAKLIIGGIVGIIIYLISCSIFKIINFRVIFNYIKN